MSNRPSYAQIEGLVEFLEQNPGVAKGFLRTIQGKLETKRKWAALASSLNALGGAIKDGQGWAKYWAEKKCALKKQCAQLSASIQQTGGGSAQNLPTLSALDNRLIAVMGGQDFGARDTYLAVNPFLEVTIDTIAASTNMSPDISPRTLIPVRLSPILGTSQDHVPPHPSTIPLPTPVLEQQSAPPRTRARRRSAIPRPVDMEMERFTQIEEKRVEAEGVTAQAQAQLAAAIPSIATAIAPIGPAIASMAAAISSIALSIDRLADKIS